MSGEQFLAQRSSTRRAVRAVCAAGRAPTGSSNVTMVVPASYVWYSLETDGSDRLQSEVIVSPGHLIERRFQYPTQPNQ